MSIYNYLCAGLLDQCRNALAAAVGLCSQGPPFCNSGLGGARLAALVKGMRTMLEAELAQNESLAPLPRSRCDFLKVASAEVLSPLDGQGTRRGP